MTSWLHQQLPFQGFGLVNVISPYMVRYTLSVSHVAKIPQSPETVPRAMAMNIIIVYKSCTLQGSAWKNIAGSRSKQRIVRSNYVYRTVKTCKSLKRDVCAVDITIQRLTHTHRRRSLRIVLKWCAVAANILRVFISNASLLRSTPGHIPPGRALQGARCVYNNYIHGHYIINYHSSAVQECLGAERNGV